MPDDLEFSISQYLDDGLPPLETATLEQRFATDPEARRLLDQYQRLNALVKEVDGPPEINWKLLAVRLSDSLAAEETPARNYSIGWLTWPARAALAAAVLIAAGVFFRGAIDSPVSPDPAVAPLTVAVIEGPEVEIAATGPKIVEIAIGPADEAAELNARYADTIISRPTRVLIASSIDENATPAHDGPTMPY